MKLEFRQKLYPYRTHQELAQAFHTSVSSLKRALRRLDTSGQLNLESLATLFDITPSQVGGDLSQTFFQHRLCLVCGSPMKKVEGRQGGWGEFEQCELCGFAAHENADYDQLRATAFLQIEELQATLERAQRILAHRQAQGRHFGLVAATRDKGLDSTATPGQT